jgi:hypothetical protein
MCFGTCLGVPYACTFCNDIMGRGNGCFITSRNNETFRIKAKADSSYEIKLNDESADMLNNEARNFFEAIEREVSVGGNTKEYIVTFEFKAHLHEFSLDQKAASKLAKYLKTTIDTHAKYSERFNQDMLDRKKGS